MKNSWEKLDEQQKNENKIDTIAAIDKNISFVLKMLEMRV